MDDPTVKHLCMTAAKSKLFKRVVCFNCRGTGHSNGWKSLGYSVDGQDAFTLLVRLLPGANDSSICLIGYSYGSLVATECLRLLLGSGQSRIRPRGFMSLGFPLGGLSRLFLFSGSSWEMLMSLLSQSQLSFLLVLGDSDQFTAIDTAKALVEKAAGLVRLRVIENCDHFIISHKARVELSDICLEWLKILAI